MTAVPVTSLLPCDKLGPVSNSNRESPILSNFAGIDLQAMPSLARGEVRAHRVQQVRATRESLEGYGQMVENFATHPLTIVTWPAGGWRPIVTGTGNEAGFVEDSFIMERRGQIQYAVNHAVGRSYVTGWYSDPATASGERAAQDVTRLFTHEANYHPDGGQIFSPRGDGAFVALLARAGDDVSPEDFVAFYCDGSFGLHIDPGVWHQPVFPVAERARFQDRQGRVHACVAVDFLREFGCYLEVPMIIP